MTVRSLDGEDHEVVAKDIWVLLTSSKFFSDRDDIMRLKHLMILIAGEFSTSLELKSCTPVSMRGL